jgi:hypothetical protein
MFGAQALLECLEDPPPLLGGGARRRLVRVFRLQEGAVPGAIYPRSMHSFVLS